MKIFNAIKNQPIEKQASILWKRHWGEFFGNKSNLRHRDLVLQNFILLYYNESHRKYHNLNHIVDCLEIFEEYFVDEASCPEEIRMAIWFHDLVNDVRASDNERRSSDIARMALLAGGASELSAARVCDMIRHTAYGGFDNNTRSLKLSYDTKIMLDIDLSILASDKEDLLEYDNAVREEYGYISDNNFYAARSVILKSLLEHRIFKTQFAIAEWEDDAQLNINYLIRRCDERSGHK